MSSQTRIDGLALERPFPDNSWAMVKPQELPELVLVEDREDDEIFTKRGLAKSGIACHITIRRDGEEALDHLLSEAVPAPTLILLDFNLPKLNGREILCQLRKHEKTRWVPVVIFSGEAPGVELLECYRVGANSWVTKPSDPEEYMDRLIWIAHYWLGLNQCVQSVH